MCRVSLFFEYGLVIEKKKKQDKRRDFVYFSRKTYYKYVYM